MNLSHPLYYCRSTRICYFCYCELSFGSSEESGNVTAEQLPLREYMHLEPVSPYAVARVSQEMIDEMKG